MQSEHAFVRNETFPSWWPNAVGKFLSVASPGFQLTLQDSTHVQVVAGPDDQAAVIAIAGLMRWNEATVSRAHPGGAAGSYDVFVTAAADSIVNTPDPFTDATNRAFALAILAAGSTPTIVPGTVDAYRKVGSLQWDGTKITGLTSTVPRATPPGLTPTPVSASATAVSGQAIIVTGSSPATITLPAPAVGAIVAVVNRSSGGTTVAGSNIYGVGLAAASSFLLGTVGANATLLSDGTNWNLIAGQQDTGWVPLNLTAGLAAGAHGPTPAYRQIGDRIYLRGSVTLTGSPTISLVAQLPASATPSYNPPLAGFYSPNANSLTSGSTITPATIVVQTGGIEFVQQFDTANKTLWFAEGACSFAL